MTFGGVMPPPASMPISKPTDVATGVETLVSANAATTPSTQNKIGVVSGRWAVAVPRTVVIAAGSPTDEQTWPPGMANASGTPQPQSFQGGFITLAGAAVGWVQPVARQMACLIEYGAGSESLKAWMDWTPGAYNLPACEWARVSALQWGTGWAGSPNYVVAASIVAGNLQGAHVPVASGSKFFAAAEVEIIPVPQRARAFDVYLETSVGAAPVITFERAANGHRDYALGSFWPGSTPLPVSTVNGTIQITCTTAAILRAAFYLEL